MDCKYMEMIDVGRCTRKSLRLDQTCGDSTGSNWIEKDKIVHLIDLFVRMGEKGQSDLVCGTP